jgi:hypothetical protein
MIGSRLESEPGIRFFICFLIVALQSCHSGCPTGLPDFSDTIPKWVIIYQMIIKYTKWALNTPIGRKIDQITIKYTNIFHCKTLQKFSQRGIFGLKFFHLAILQQTISEKNITFFCSDNFSLH